MSDEFKSKLEKYHYIRKVEKAEQTTKDICAKCDTELQRIKRYKPLPITSKYRKKHEIDYYPPTCGFSHRFVDDPDYFGHYSEWLEAFESFKNKTVNIYGQKVDRSNMFNENYSFGNAQIKNKNA